MKMAQLQRANDVGKEKVQTKNLKLYRSVRETYFEARAPII